MQIIGYVNGDITIEKINEFKKMRVTSIVVDEVYLNEKEKDKSLDSIVENLSEKDMLIIDNLYSLNRTLSELGILLKKIREKNINLIILNKEELLYSMTDAEFFDFIVDLHDENQKVVKEKSRLSKKKMQHVGRPKVSEETINRIRSLRNNKKLTLKETADLCNVSLGTVYKYTEKTSN